MDGLTSGLIGKRSIRLTRYATIRYDTALEEWRDAGYGTVLQPHDTAQGGMAEDDAVRYCTTRCGASTYLTARHRQRGTVEHNLEWCGAVRHGTARHGRPVHRNQRSHRVVSTRDGLVEPTKTSAATSYDITTKIDYNGLLRPIKTCATTPCDITIKFNYKNNDNTNNNKSNKNNKNNNNNNIKFYSVSLTWSATTETTPERRGFPARRRWGYHPRTL